MSSERSRSRTARISRGYFHACAVNNSGIDVLWFHSCSQLLHADAGGGIQNAFSGDVSWQRLASRF